MFSSTTGCTLTEMPAGPIGRLSGAIAHYIQAGAHSYARERSPTARVSTSLLPTHQVFREVWKAFSDASGTGEPGRQRP